MSTPTFSCSATLPTDRTCPEPPSSALAPAMGAPDRRARPGRGVVEHETPCSSDNDTPLDPIPRCRYVCAEPGRSTSFGRDIRCAFAPDGRTPRQSRVAVRALPGPVRARDREHLRRQGGPRSPGYPAIPDGRCRDIRARYSDTRAGAGSGIRCVVCRTRVAPLPTTQSRRS
jgi:hypothetical protein